MKRAALPFISLPATLLVCLMASTGWAQEMGIALSVDSLRLHVEGMPLSGNTWRFHPGDSSHWKDIDYSDHHWQSADPFFGRGNPLDSWQGIGWFRAWIVIDSSLAGETLALRLHHEGASDIYVDGRRAGGFGEVGTGNSDTKKFRPLFDLTPIRFDSAGRHLIAVRYANYQAVFPDFVGFKAWIGEYRQQTGVIKEQNRSLAFAFWGVVAQVILALLHFCLFLFYPRSRINLYYSLYVLSLAIAIGSYIVTIQSQDPHFRYWAYILHWIGNIAGKFPMLLLFYYIGYGYLPRWRLAFFGTGMLIYLFIILPDPGSKVFTGYSYFAALVFLDGLWALSHTLRRREPGVWLIGLGMLLLVFSLVSSALNLFGLWGMAHSEASRMLVLSVTVLSLPVCFSIYLALDFARVNRKTLTHEIEKGKLLTEYAERLEVTVQERTEEVRLQADKLREMDNAKSRFFINLTHEFRTPLTLILGPAQRLLTKQTDGETRSLVQSIRHNAERLLQLINQLLDLGKLESGKMELHTAPTDIVRLIRTDIASFASLADQKQLRLLFHSEDLDLWAMADRDKLRKIVFNLVTNAIKFTPQHGTVSVTLHLLTETFPALKLLVKDTGIGIRPDKMPYIFDRFYQADPSDTRMQEGSGIGLALTRELVELMGGSINISSAVGEGTEVIVVLPYVKAEKPVDNENAEETTTPVADATVDLATADLAAVDLPTVDLPIVDPEAPLLLIVEDNDELRSFIRLSLSDSNRVIEARNGAEGMALAEEQIPDVIVTDLMMPVKDGYQLCAAIKQSEKTSHIPVIMLTAKADRDSRLTGLETGADAYLGKPFEQRELLAVVANLLHLKAEWRKKYSRSNQWLAGESVLPSTEQLFLERIRTSILAHLDDEQYSVDRLGEDVGLSRTQLHRKLKAIVNQGPGELIRIARMERAYDLLRTRAGNVSEVAYMVGFGNPSTFSTSFSRYFGFAPSEAGDNKR